MPQPRATCPCCAPSLGRRGFLATALAATVAATTRSARAGDGRDYDSMLFTCIDPRLIRPTRIWMEQRGLTDNFSHFAFAGAAIGVVAPAFATWRPAFWDNLAASTQLHRIDRVIVVNHRDCGAAGIAYGAESIATPAAESALHRRVFEEFRTQLTQRQPGMGVEGGLMALDGSIEMFG